MINLLKLRDDREQSPGNRGNRIRFEYPKSRSQIAHAQRLSWQTNKRDDYKKPIKAQGWGLLSRERREPESGLTLPRSCQAASVADRRTNERTKRWTNERMKRIVSQRYADKWGQNPWGSCPSKEETAQNELGKRDASLGFSNSSLLHLSLSLSVSLSSLAYFDIERQLSIN